MRRRKPLNQREAAALARAHGGSLHIARITPGGEKEILHIRSIGDLRPLGRHPTSWRKAFEAAGVHGI